MRERNMFVEGAGDAELARFLKILGDDVEATFAHGDVRFDPAVWVSCKEGGTCACLFGALMLQQHVGSRRPIGYVQALPRDMEDPLARAVEMLRGAYTEPIKAYFGASDRAFALLRGAVGNAWPGGLRKHNVENAVDAIRVADALRHVATEIAELSA